MTVTTLFQKKRTGKVWRWVVEAKGNQVISAFGYLDGATQTTSETALVVNVGKANEVTAKQQALLLVERKIKKKLDNGYSRTQKDAEAQDLGDAMTFEALPKSFCPAKPITTISDKALRELWDSGNISVQRKFDGMCHFAVRHANGLSILSRGKLEEKSNNVPQIVKPLSKLPNGTILNGEICLDPRIGDDFKFVSSVMRCKDSKKAVERQVLKPGFMHYMVFDVLFWAGNDVTDYPFSQRIALFEKWASRHISKHGAVQTPVNLGLTYTFDDLFNGNNCLAIRTNLEGYVVWNTLETTEVRFDGKEARLNCYKWKRVFTEDVIAMNPTTGKGRNENRLGQVEGYQYSDAGELVFVGMIGGGFDDASRLELWNNQDVFPCVMEVKCSERLKSNKLRFPVFVRLRPDKDLKECVMQLMPRNGLNKT